jgi:hypothetical protein
MSQKKELGSKDDFPVILAEAKESLDEMVRGKKKQMPNSMLRRFLIGNVAKKVNARGIEVLRRIRLILAKVDSCSGLSDKRKKEMLLRINDEYVNFSKVIKN